MAAALIRRRFLSSFVARAVGATAHRSLDIGAGRSFDAAASASACMPRRRWVSGPGWGVDATVVLADDTEQVVSASPGLSLLDAMSDMSDVWQGGACGGIGACSTCRVIVEKAWASKLPEADDAELDMLDAAAVQDQGKEGEMSEEELGRARLACQVRSRPGTICHSCLSVCICLCVCMYVCMSLCVCVYVCMCV